VVNIRRVGSSGKFGISSPGGAFDRHASEGDSIHSVVASQPPYLN
jgi:hypothetical protein